MTDTNQQQKIPFLVRVSCMTFNHAPYIEDAMNGFTMQETNFQFVCTIMDDASTDGEPEVIRKYLQEHFDLEDKTIVRNEETDDYMMTFARHKENHNCFFAVYFLKYNHTSIKKAKLLYCAKYIENVKYTATCEGDDYWIDSCKLYDQVNYLEKNSDYGLVYSRAKILKGDRIIGTVGRKLKNEYDLYIENPIPTLTTCFRTDIYNNYLEEIEPLSKGWKMGDYPFRLYIHSKYKIAFIKKDTAVYRILNESASHSSHVEKMLGFLNSSKEISTFFMQRHPIFSQNEHLKRMVNRNYNWRKIKLLSQKDNCLIIDNLSDLSLYHKMIVFLFNRNKSFREYARKRWKNQF